MVENVEDLQTERKGQALMDWEAAAKCGVHTNEVRSAESVAPKIPEGASSVLRERGFVQEGEVSGRLLSDLTTSVDGLWIDQVGPVEADAGQRVVNAGGDIERESTREADERRDLPVISQRTSPAMKAVKVARGYEGGVEDVANVVAAVGTIHTRVRGVLESRSSDVSW